MVKLQHRQMQLLVEVTRGFAQQYSPDQVEPDNPSLRGEELLRKRNSERTGDPHGLRGKTVQLSDHKSRRGWKPTLRILK
jgi:hypothetical protein